MPELNGKVHRALAPRCRPICRRDGVFLRLHPERLSMQGLRLYLTSIESLQQLSASGHLQQ